MQYGLHISIMIIFDCYLSVSVSIDCFCHETRNWLVFLSHRVIFIKSFFRRAILIRVESTLCQCFKNRAQSHVVFVCSVFFFQWFLFILYVQLCGYIFVYISIHFSFPNLPGHKSVRINLFGF